MADRQSDAFKVYVGWDAREVDAYEVARGSLLERSSIPIAITPLHLRQLELVGLMRRPRRALGKGNPMVIADGRVTRRMTSAAQRGTLWDEISGAPMATEFAIARFLTPLLAHTGWALFVDCDVLFLADVAELLALADPQKAVMCVQHGALESNGLKMDGQVQLPYVRKNWSSVMLFNCDHPANKGLSLELINRVPGRDLHRFCWLDDRWIGALPAEWNWLVGVQPRPAEPKIAHFTLGGPWLAGWTPHEHDDLWLAASENFGTGLRAADAG
jgi:hypothetical protein